jgi:hypothetical protein
MHSSLWRCRLRWHRRGQVGDARASRAENSARSPDDQRTSGTPRPQRGRSVERGKPGRECTRDKLDCSSLRAKELWFAKISSHARRLRISNIHIDVHEPELTKKACKIVTNLWRNVEGADGASAGTNRIHRQPAARAIRPGSWVGRARLAENAAAQPKIPAQDPSPRSQPKIPAQDPSPRYQPKIPAQAKRVSHDL